MKILFDTGYSDAFLKNAQKLNINLLNVDYIVISHGHIDHTGGLPFLLNKISEAKIEKIPYQKAFLIAHPAAFMIKKTMEIGSIGSLVNENILQEYFHLQYSKEPLWLNPNVVFLGEIPRETTFEIEKPIGKTIINGTEKEDHLLDDSALVIRLPDGLVVVTGCSHAGICNIINYAKKIFQENKVLDIIGGFHLLNPDREQLDRTIDYLERLTPNSIHACHCIDLPSKVALSRSLPLKEVGSGLKIEY